MNTFLSVKTCVELYYAFKELYTCAYALLKSKIEVSAVQQRTRLRCISANIARNLGLIRSIG
jgi:hypothetical protein